MHSYLRSSKIRHTEDIRRPRFTSAWERNEFDGMSACFVYIVYTLYFMTLYRLTRLCSVI